MHIDFAEMHRLRKERKISVKGFCELCGVSRTTLWDWEHGKRVPRYEATLKIAEVLNISTERISNYYFKADADDNTDTLLANTLQGWSNIFEENSNIELDKFEHYFKKLKANVRKSSLIINAIMDSMNSILCIKDNNLEYVVANKAFLKNIGFDLNYRVTGKRDNDFFTQKESAVSEQLDKKVLRNRVPITNIEGYIPGTRKKRWGITTKYPVIDTDDRLLGVITVITDLTDKRREEKKREILEKSIDHIDDIGISIGKFMSNNKRRFVFDYVNKTMKDIFSISDLNGLKNIPENWYKLLPEESRAIYEKRRKNFQFPSHYVYSAIHPEDGRKVWLQDSVYEHEGKLISIVKDITPLKSEQEKTIAQIEKLRFIFDAMPAAVELIDYKTDEVVYSNNKVEQTFGYTKEKVADWNYWINNIVHPDDREQQLQYDADGSYPESRTYRIVKPDGSVAVLNNSHVITEYDGKKYRLITNSIIM